MTPPARPAAEAARTVRAAERRDVRKAELRSGAGPSASQPAAGGAESSKGVGVLNVLTILLGFFK